MKSHRGSAGDKQRIWYDTPMSFWAKESQLISESKLEEAQLVTVSEGGDTTTELGDTYDMLNAQEVLGWMIDQAECCQQTLYTNG